MTYELGASLHTLRRRAAMQTAIRSFFAARGVLEVETPMLSSSGATDPAIESVIAGARSLGEARLYLHTSPEFAMKRLLSAGSGDIYQLCRVFRDDELGRWHQPEFTLLEWYRVGFDEQRLMTEVAELIETALAAAAQGGAVAARRIVRLRYAEALQGALGVGPDAPAGELAGRLERRGIEVPRGLTHDAVLDLCMGTAVLASFDPAALTFVYDYPASQAALARLKPTEPPVAARFEAFSGGIELANGFQELADAVEQRRRFERELEIRRANGQDRPPLDEALLRALASLPDCAGVALGFDRLVALAIGEDSLAGVMSFTHRQEGTDL